jgi:bacteriocin-like protein
MADINIKDLGNRNVFGIDLFDDMELENLNLVELNAKEMKQVIGGMDLTGTDESRNVIDISKGARSWSCTTNSFLDGGLQPSSYYH